MGGSQSLCLPQASPPHPGKQGPILRVLSGLLFQGTYKQRFKSNLRKTLKDKSLQ